MLFVEPIPIFESDAGVNRITAEVAWSGPGGVEVRTNVVDTLVVRGHQPEFAAFSPNPVRDLQEATLLLQLRTPGTVTIRLYNLEGEEVYVGTQSLARADRRGILPGECGSVTCVSLASSSARNLDLVSGPYFARVEFRGDDGSNASSSARLVVLR